MGRCSARLCCCSTRDSRGVENRAVGRRGVVLANINDLLVSCGYHQHGGGRPQRYRRPSVRTIQRHAMQRTHAVLVTGSIRYAVRRRRSCLSVFSMRVALPFFLRRLVSGRCVHGMIDCRDSRARWRHDRFDLRVSLAGVFRPTDDFHSERRVRLARRARRVAATDRPELDRRAAC